MTAAPLHHDPVVGPVPRGRIVAWGIWDWGSAAFNAVILTFVYSVYLTDAVGDDLPGDISANTWFSWSLGLAGFFIAVLAPVTGQRADAGGRRKLSLGIWTGLTVMAMAGPVLGEERLPLPVARPAAARPRLDLLRVRLRLVQRDAAPGFDAGQHRPGLGVRLVDGVLRRHRAAADLLHRVHRTRRRLVRGDLRGRPEHPDGGAVRRGLVRHLRDSGAAEGAGNTRRLPAREAGRVSSRPTGCCSATCAELYRTHPHTVYFLGASALFRDGLAAVFAFGAILAVTVYGIDSADVLIFGVVANVSSAIGALVAGRFDDRVGPKAVIVVSLSGMLISGGILLFVSGPTMFWIFGLFLCLFVGPAQSSSRTFLARLAPIGKEGQLFGLYATTGRAVSFLAPTLFGIFIVPVRLRPRRHHRHPAGAGRRAAVPAAGQVAGAGRVPGRIPSTRSTA